MTTYLIRRFFQSILFIVSASFVVYTVLVMLMRDGPYDRYQNNIELAFVPGASGAVGGNLSEDISELEQRYELDKPWPLNFVAWLFDPADTTEATREYDTEAQAFKRVPVGIDIRLGDFRLAGSGILTGDLGESERYARGQSVTMLMGQRWGYTWPLLAASLLIALVVGIPLGVLGAVNHRSKLDHFVTFISFSGISVPPFVLGLLLILVLSILPNNLRLLNGWTWLPILPPGGIGDSDNLADSLRHMFLPALTLAIPQVAVIARYSRFTMLEVLRQEYIRTAWAKGLSGRRVVFRHALRNTLLPLITVVGLLIPTIITGTVVVEVAFAYHGMGHLYYRSLGGCVATITLLAQEPPPCPRIGYFPIDYPIALGMTVVFIAVVAFANILADFLYTAADPRVNFRNESRS